MKKIYKKRHYDKKNMPFRVYYATNSTKTVCFACLVSCVMVFIPFLLLYKGEYNEITIIILCLLICSFTMFFAIHILIKEARVFVEPIEKLEEAVSKVTKGNFEIQIQWDNDKKKIKELNKLIDNFNQMTKALRDMEYMNKDFINNVSHEVKTPIASITGFTEILMDAELDEEERREYLSLVNSESLRLSRLCESMLNMSRLDSQVIVNKNEEVNVTEQIRKAIIMLSEKWVDKEHEFDLNIDEINVNSDSDLLQQIWINLIDNAMKYSDRGTVIHISGKDNGSDIEISISDEGIGISEEKLQYIFQRFYQCEESHKNYGNGLGLSIVKRIIELLNGNIVCTSIKGIGTKIIVTLPK